MADNTTTLVIILKEIKTIFSSLKNVISDKNKFTELCENYNLIAVKKFTNDIKQLKSLAETLEGIIKVINPFIQSDFNFNSKKLKEAKNIIKECINIGKLIKKTFSEIEGNVNDNVQIDAAVQLFDAVIIEHLKNNRKKLFSTLQFAEIIIINKEGKDPSVINWKSFISVLKEPAALIETWNTTSFSQLLNAFGIYNEIVEEEEDKLKIPFINNDPQFGLAVLPEQNSASLDLSLYGNFNGKKIDEDSDNWNIILRSDLQSEDDFGIILSTEGVEIKEIDGASIPNFNLNLTAQNKDTALKDILNIFGTKLSIASPSFSFDIDYNDNDLDITLSALINKAVFDLSSEGSDSFISSILPTDSSKINFDFGIAYSFKKGLHFQGSNDLNIKIPSRLDLGIVKFEDIGLSVNLDAQNPKLEITTNIESSLGPVYLKTEEVGTQLSLKVLNDEYDLSLGFKPPAGIGISIDASIVKGGGYLFFDYEKGEYIGVGSVSIKKVLSVSVISIITTKAPPGQTEPGYSMLLLIAASDFELPLGFSFTLLGLGGLFAANRGMDLEALRNGVYNKTLNNILFPEEPEKHVDTIIGSLNSYFPIEADSYTFGIMAKVGWGTPRLLTIEMGLIIKVPEPVRIAILGVIESKLPDEDKPIIILKASFIGTLDTGEKLITFDATLAGSEILGMKMSGDIVYRQLYGDNPMFLLSAGGFHPNYQPPHLHLPAKINKITVSILPKNPRLTLQGYFALTSNTLQFGANVDFYYKKGVKVKGFFSFDVLIQFNPFYLDAALRAGVSVTYRGYGFSVEFYGSLVGPGPWVVKGYVKLSCWLFDIKKSIRSEFGKRIETSVPEIEVLPILIKELDTKENYEAIIWSNSKKIAEARYLADPNEEKTKILLHPLGGFRFKQSMIPLNETLDKVGASRVKGANKFALKVDGRETSIFKDNFAPAQFFDLEESEKLSRKSYEKYDSGIELLADNLLTFGDSVAMDIEYETQIIEDLTEPKDENPFERVSTLIDFKVYSQLIKANSLHEYYENERDRIKEKSTKIISIKSITIVEYSNDTITNLKQISEQSLLTKRKSDIEKGRTDYKFIPKFELKDF